MPDGSISGVAAGNLGTGTALDDTQVYSVDALASADHPDDIADAGPDVSAPQAASAVARDAAPVTDSPPVEPARVASPAQPVPAAVALPRATTQPIRTRRGRTGGYQVGVLAAAAIVLVVAGVLSLHDGGLVGGGGPDSGLTGPATFPPAPSFGVLQTTGPEPTPPAKHHGRGHGGNSQ